MNSIAETDAVALHLGGIAIRLLAGIAELPPPQQIAVVSTAFEQLLVEFEGDRIELFDRLTSAIRESMIEAGAAQ